MSISNKYSSISGCGCQSSVQTAPTPCCDSGQTIYKNGVCFLAACTVAASVGGFFLKFSNMCQTLLIDSNVLYFWHPATGLMQITGVDEYGMYSVVLVDETKAGGVINKDDCVLYVIIPPTSLTSAGVRCLNGNFIAPGVGLNETIYIENGTNVPIGSTITFTANGETGSYQVVSFISASNGVYAYEVQNTGSGHTPGTIISGGATGTCLVPIELVTDVDLCDLSTTNVADTLITCVNGSPRGLVSTSINDVVKGDGSGGFELGQMSGFDCCVVTAGVLKFTGDTCNGGGDNVVLEDINIACFEAAWDEVLAANFTSTGQTKMPMRVEGFEVVVTGYDSGTKTLSLEPVDPDILDGGAIFEWPAGTQICLGECCESCLGGPQFTNHKLVSSPAPPLGEEFATIYQFNTGAVLEYETGTPHHYLIGFDNAQPLAVTVLEIDATYDDDPELGPGKPVLSDPLLFRNKICNDQGCDKIINIKWNYEIVFFPLPAGIRVSYEIGHYVGSSDTLADDSTPNPFTSVGSASASANSILGPTLDASGLLTNTAIGYGGIGNAKNFPYIADSFEDTIYLEKCNCAKSIVWCYVVVEDLAAVGSGNIEMNLGIRQQLIHYNANEIASPQNNPLAEGFNA